MSEWVQKVENTLAKEGFPFPKRHEEHEDIDLPRNIEILSNTELGNHLGVWAALYSRSKFELAKAESSVNTLDLRMHWLKQACISEAGPKAKITVVKAEIDASPEMMSLSVKRNEASIRANLLEALTDGYRKKYEAVSREIARREADKRQWEKRDLNEGFVQGRNDQRSFSVKDVR
jgi:hypothetical protein